MAFEARFGGFCAACDGRIEPGDVMTYDDDNQTVHVRCPDSDADRFDAEAQRAPLCPRCGLNHPGEC
jgi:hypothetical protein